MKFILLFSILFCVTLLNAQTNLVTFDGADGTTFNWKLVNDPVMGGLSNSTWNIDVSGGIARWSGEVKIVPSLQAPGFCNAETTDGMGIKKIFNDVSQYSHLEIKARASMDADGYKVSFAADTLNPQFASFKAPFELPGDNQWHLIAIPFTGFSNDWSAYTGDCFTKDPSGKQHYCCDDDHPEVCPTTKNLKDIQQIGLWVEGSANKFDFEVAWIRGGYGNTTLSRTGAIIDDCVPVENKKKFSTDLPTVGDFICSAPPQNKLLYNVSNRYDSTGLPIPMADGEDLVTAICCDSAFAPYAEPNGFYARPDVQFFNHLNKNEVTTFYDPVCGIPLFQAPVNRTFEEFQSDTDEHGWPSFREAEIFHHNINIHCDGTMTSSCGTHLGSFMIDDIGNRYCIDLTCISGQKSTEIVDKIVYA
jgi:peptide methionine sulfoxide reductase MsrB